MRILIERAVVLQRDVAKHLPTHVMVGGKFKRTVFDEFGIQTAVGSEVDVFEEHAPYMVGWMSAPIFLVCTVTVLSCAQTVYEVAMSATPASRELIFMIQ